MLVRNTGNSARGDSATGAPAAIVRACERFVVLLRLPRRNRVTVRATAGAGERAVVDRAWLLRALGIRLRRCLLHAGTVSRARPTQLRNKLATRRRGAGVAKESQ